MLLLIILALISLTTGLTAYSLRYEEPRRLIIAYEMAKSGSYLQPTFLGENYYKKPPLFSWLIILSSKIFGWNEITVRAISIFFTILTAILIFLFSFYISGKAPPSVLSSLIYITFSDILYWYGWLGEIDVTLGFFVFLMMIFQYLAVEKNSCFYKLISSILCGVAFLIKGFPVFGFFFLTYIAIAIWIRRIKHLFTFSFIISAIPAVLIPGFWIFSTDDPILCMKTLFMQSLMRIKESRDTVKLAIHLIKYPLLNIKQTLPTSAILIYLLLNRRLLLDQVSSMIMFIFIINYIPYLLSAGSNGRYIIPIFPLLSIASASIIANSTHLIRRSFYILIILSIAGRSLYGSVGLPALEKRKGSPRHTARMIINTIGREATIAFDCKKHKSICAYIDIYTGKILISPDINKTWQYVISCSGRKYEAANPIAVFSINGDSVYIFIKDSQ